MKVESKKKIILGAIIALYAIVIILFFTTIHENAFLMILRLFALLGLLSLSIAAIMTPFAVKLYKIFGKSFLKLHHFFAISGIILSTLHPVVFAIYVANPLVFVPVVNDWILFWELAGRPALIIIYIGAAAGVLRKTYKKSWKKFHALLYIALFFGLIHGTLIGKDFSNIAILIIFYVLFTLSIAALILKRYQNYQRKQKIKSRKNQEI